MSAPASPAASRSPLPGDLLATCRQLADDLRWLEDYTQERSGPPEELARVRLALAILTNHLGPFLTDSATPQLNIIVVGGAGTGKSTIANFLMGAAVAETNPQAGYTRHPIAYSLADGQPTRAPLLATSELGRLKLLHEPQPGNVDADVYQVRVLPRPSDPEHLLEQARVWDCPDMTTWHAVGYTARLIEVIGLADLVVYVASDERYNDALPTQFLRLILQAGKPVVACVVKVPEKNTAAILEHFRADVIARIPECTRVSACVAVPFLNPSQLADPLGQGGLVRKALIEPLHWWLRRGPLTRAEVARGGLEFLRHHEQDLLGSARRDLKALEDWQKLVDKGRDEFSNRYRREYLSNEQFPRFNQSLIRLMELLELPGVGQVVSKTLWVLRTPYRFAKGFFNKMTAGPGGAEAFPEEPVLRTALAGWLDYFRKEAAVRDDHPIWKQIKAGFDEQFFQQAQVEYQRCQANYQAKLHEEVDRTARSIFEDLEKNPTALNALRGVKATLEIGTIVGTVVTLGAHLWLDVAMVPVMAALTQELVEQLGKGYVDRQREAARQRQKQLFDDLLAQPLAQWLGSWPARGGTTLQRLKEVVQSVPASLTELQEVLNQKIRGQPA